MYKKTTSVPSPSWQGRRIHLSCLMWLLCQGTKAPTPVFQFTGCPIIRTLFRDLLTTIPCRSSDETMSLWSVWPTCASSCGEPGDPSGRRPVHTCDTERAGVQCVSWSDGWAHLTWQTSSHSLPSYSGTAFHLRDTRTFSLDYRRHGAWTWQKVNFKYSY